MKRFYHFLYSHFLPDYHWSVIYARLAGRTGLLALSGGASEEEDMGLGLVRHVMNPSLALLDSHVSPLGLGHEMRLGNKLGEILGEHDVPVLELVVVVLVAVVDVLARHGGGRLS